jgi:hypothetical protein
MGSNFLGAPSNPTKLRCAAWAGDEVLPRLRTHPEATDIPVVDLSTDAKLSPKHTYCRQAHRRS